MAKDKNPFAKEELRLYPIACLSSLLMLMDVVNAVCAARLCSSPDREGWTVARLDTCDTSQILHNSGMLEKSAKLSSIIQGLAAALYLYFYFSQRQAADSAQVGTLNHPSWLSLFSIIFLAASVLTSSVLNLVVLSNKGIDIHGKILWGYLDTRTFRVEASANTPRWINLPRGCSLKVYAELVNVNDVGARFYPEKTRLELRVGRERFYGNWERILPSQQAMNEGKKETLNDLFENLQPNIPLQQGIPWNGYAGFIVENFNRALLHDRIALTANVKVRIHDTLGGVHTIRGDKVRLAIEEVCLPSEFAA